jgi:hypothetical protein
MNRWASTRTRRSALPSLALCIALAGCGGGSETSPMGAGSTSGEATGAPLAEASLAAESPAAENVGDAASPTACVPGNWSTNMRQFVKTFQTPGKPKYQSGTYTFTFTPDYSFTAVGDDVTFRLSQKQGYVDVHNTWSESGMWGASNATTTFDEILVIQGVSYNTNAEELATVLATDESRLIAVQGQAYKAGESYGMVNGSMRTPPLSDAGTAISAVGSVDCDAGEMELIVAGTGWRGGFTLTRQ